MEIPTKVPEKGFYYHYKHDPAKAFNDYAYEVLGLALHTESKEYTVLYRPLYENKYLGVADFSVRPYEMFIETIEKEGKVTPRFTKITDPEIIAKLEKIRTEMYGE